MKYLLFCILALASSQTLHHKSHLNHNRISSTQFLDYSDANISVALQNVSSQEFRDIAMQTYSKVLPCILDTWMMKERKLKFEDFQFPHDAQYHFERIKNITSSYRYAPVHEYAGYEGIQIYIFEISIKLSRSNILMTICFRTVDRKYIYREIY